MFKSLISSLDKVCRIETSLYSIRKFTEEIEIKRKKGEINKAKAVALAMDADNMPIEKISQYVIESVLSI